MPSTRPAQPIVNLIPRLEASARAVADAERNAAAEREIRRQLVHQAADEGIPMRTIAAAIGGKGTGMVSKILSNPGPDEEG